MRNNIVPVVDLSSRSYFDKSKFFIGTSIFKKMCHLQLHPSSTKCIFRQMSRRDADDEFIWEIIQFLLLTFIHLFIQKKLSTLLALEYSKKIPHLKMHPFSSKCLFRKMSWRDMDDEFIQETIQFLLWTSIGGGFLAGLTLVIAHHTIGIKEQLGLGCSSQLHHQTTYSSFASRRDILSQYKKCACSPV